MVSSRCLPDTLCGISSRFQLLSPSERQVAHALLTRPPLSSDSLDRSLDPKSPVRLACVRHAASVRPEPGSNSQIWYLNCTSVQIKPIRAVRHSLFKRIVFSKPFGSLKNPSLVLIRISFCLHCLIYKVHSLSVLSIFHSAVSRALD